MKKNFISIRGTDFVKNEKKFKIRGVAIGSFLNLEHFMLKIAGVETDIKGAFAEIYGAEKSEIFWKTFRSCFINEKDFEFMKKININTIRLPFNYKLFFDDYLPFMLKKEGFLELDRIIEMATKYEIYVILDLHAAPGGQNPDWHSDNSTGEPLFWKFFDFQQRIINLWGEIAKRYKNNPYILGYDILNEPVIENREISGKFVNDFYKNVLREIRKFDRNHIVFLEGDFYASDTTSFEILDDPLVAYSVHYYPFFFTDIEHYSKLNETEKKEWLKSSLFNNVSITDVFNRLKRPLWCGETGALLSFPKSYSENQLQKILEIFEENNISWTIWTYKDAGCMGILHCKDESPWVKNFENVNTYRDFLKDFNEATKLALEFIKNISPNLFPNIELIRKVKFKLLSIRDMITSENFKFKLKEIPFEKVLTLPESFLFENCEMWNGAINIIKKITTKI
jgi:aryl-phospho-beta-D-glucosidase BglC (GH1 family)